MNYIPPQLKKELLREDLNFRVDQNFEREAQGI